MRPLELFTRLATTSRTTSVFLARSACLAACASTPDMRLSTARFTVRGVVPQISAAPREVPTSRWAPYISILSLADLMVCPFGRSVVGLHHNRLRPKGPSSGWFSEGWVLLLGHQRSPLVGHTRGLPVDHTRGLFHGRGQGPRYVTSLMSTSPCRYQKSRFPTYLLSQTAQWGDGFLSRRNCSGQSPPTGAGLI